MREAFFTAKDFGYDDYEKNLKVINKMKEQGKLENLMAMAEELERTYSVGRNSMANIQRQPASQPNPAMTSPHMQVPP